MTMGARKSLAVFACLLLQMLCVILNLDERCVAPCAAVLASGYPSVLSLCWLFIDFCIHSGIFVLHLMAMQ